MYGVPMTIGLHVSLYLAGTFKSFPATLVPYRDHRDDAAQYAGGNTGPCPDTNAATAALRLLRLVAPLTRAAAPCNGQHASSQI